MRKIKLDGKTISAWETCGHGFFCFFFLIFFFFFFFFCMENKKSIFFLRSVTFEKLH